MTDMSKYATRFGLAVGCVVVSFAAVCCGLAEDSSAPREQLAEVVARNRKLEAQLADLEAALAKANAVAASLQAENAQLKKERAQSLQQAAARGRSAADGADTVASLREQLDVLQKDLQQVQADRDRQFRLVVELSGQLHKAVTELNRLKESQAKPAQGAPQQQDSTSADKHGSNLPQTKQPEPDRPPRLVGGVVLAVAEGGEVEISFGARDGLKPGHRLEVYRLAGGQGVYVGRIEVVKTTSSQKSICKSVPEFERDTIRKGDRIVSRLD